MKDLLIRLFNPIALRIAHRVSFYCVLEHRGRKSGKLFRTPLAAIRIDGGFLLPLAFGDYPNWVRNLQHGGEGTVEWLGARYPTGGAEIISWAAGAPALTSLQRRFAPLFGVKQFARVREAHDQAANTSASPAVPTDIAPSS